MEVSTQPRTIDGRDGFMRWRSTGYWVATVLLVAELGGGGIWDIARIPTGDPG